MRTTSTTSTTTRLIHMNDTHLNPWVYPWNYLGRTHHVPVLLEADDGYGNLVSTSMEIWWYNVDSWYMSTGY